MGEAGRRRACDHFAWRHVIHSYEQLWRDQEAERSARARTVQGAAPALDRAGPAAYPNPERTFAGYPTSRLSASDALALAPLASDSLGTLLAMPLTHHASGRRVTDAGLLSAALALLPCTVEDLDRFWSRSNVDHGTGRATLAWMIKYDIVRVPELTIRPTTA